MQNRKNDRANNRNDMTRQFSPLGNGIVGIVAIILLLLFWRLILLVAIVVGIVWLLWKFRRAIWSFLCEFNRSINARAQAYQQKNRNNRQSQKYYSAHCSNPFRTSRVYQSQTSDGWRNTGASGSTDRRNVIFDVTPEKEDNE